MSVEIPAELQPQITAAIAQGKYSSEQDLVNEILRIAVPVLGEYQQLRADINESITELEQGKFKIADFNAMRLILNEEYDQYGNRK